MTWNSEQLGQLCELAGEVSIEDICSYLRKTKKDVQTAAALLELDIRFYKRKTSWCPICATYRTMEPECRVCEVKAQLAQLMEDNAEAFQSLKEDEQLSHVERDALRQHSEVERPKFKRKDYESKYERDEDEERFDLLMEEWEIARLEKEKNRVKQETCRIRRNLESTAD